MALELDLKYYFTGKQCKNGHLSKRQTTSKTCYECHKLKNLNQSSVYKKDWREKNKSILIEKRKVYYNNNKENFKAKVALRRSRKQKRTVQWTNTEKIKKIYGKCPKGYVVDHIIPLNGKTVSGLHVENNLQYLTETENLSKGNKFNGWV